jgi:hypothetical protein
MWYLNLAWWVLPTRIHHAMSWHTGWVQLKVVYVSGEVAWKWVCLTPDEVRAGGRNG